jgi:hypothetical protein
MKKESGFVILKLCVFGFIITKTSHIKFALQTFLNKIKVDS